MKLKWILGGVAALVAAAGALIMPVGGGGEAQSKPRGKAAPMDLSAYPDGRPSRSLRMLFLHHSCGGQLLAAPGPNAPKPPQTRLYRYLLQKVRGRSVGSGPEEIARSAELARQLNTWVASTDGWLKDYPEKNVVVFDYYDILTGNGQSNLLVYPTKDGRDSHPARAGNERAAAAFVPFLNRVARRAGLSD